MNLFKHVKPIFNI